MVERHYSDWTELPDTEPGTKPGMDSEPELQPEPEDPPTAASGEILERINLGPEDKVQDKVEVDWGQLKGEVLENPAKHTVEIDWEQVQDQVPDGSELVRQGSGRFAVMTVQEIEDHRAFSNEPTPPRKRCDTNH